MPERCEECGTKRTDLLEHGGVWTCPEYGACDAVNLNRELIDDHFAYEGWNQ